MGIGSVVGLFIFIASDLPQINSLKDYNPPMNSKIFSRDGELLLEIGNETREVVEFKDIPQRIVDAFLAAEDDNFYAHKGIDYYGIIRAFLVNMKEGRLVQGGSTITQQVAKSFLLTKERTLSRKIKDLLLARKIEEKFTKEEILFLYLNQVYLGGGYYGVKAAFKGYFDKELSEATPAEAALVAGLLVAPGRYSPYVNPIFAKRRQNYVLKRMFETNKISQEEYQNAIAENIKMKIRKTNNLKAGYFTDWIRQEIMKSVGVDEFLTEGFQVVTTLDWSLQKKAEVIVSDKIKEVDKRQGFKGAIKNLATKEEIKNFILDQRSKILRDQSNYFILNINGSNIFEFNEQADSFEKNQKWYEDNLKSINERFRSIIEIGNPAFDQMAQFLIEGKSYHGVVTKVDDLKRIILVEIAGAKAIIPESGFDWAHARKFGEDPVYFPPVKTPSKIVKKGDVVLVKINQKNLQYDKLIHADFFKKYNDPNLKGLISKQKFIKAELDQEPEVEGALIAMNSRTGEILTLVGGIDFQRSQFNRALQSLRQPGSAFKPFIYAAALENGYNPSSIIMDSPQALGGVDDTLSWKPRNYDGEFKGPMTLRNALEVSRNIPTIKLVQDLGIEKIQNFIKRWHIKADIPRDMSLSLGSFGISLSELTKGYAIFSNGGQAIRTKHIASIKDRYGKSYLLPEPDAKWVDDEKFKITSTNVEESAEETNPFKLNLNQQQVYDPRLSYIMTNLLRGVTLYGTGSAAGRLSPNLGGKTGTTNNYVDAVFVGFSSNIVVGTWVGFDDNRPLGYGETGGKAALPMWIDYMAVAMSKYGAQEFNLPEGLISLPINKETGKVLPPGSAGFIEHYVSGFDPTNDNSPLFDQASRDNPDKASSLDDASYWENQ